MSAKINTMIYSELGQYLRQWRTDAGVKQHELAQLLGYKSPQFVSNWERGLCAPPMDQIKPILNALKVDPGQFIKIYLDIQKGALDRVLISGQTHKDEVSKTAT